MYVYVCMYVILQLSIDRRQCFGGHQVSKTANTDVALINIKHSRNTNTKLLHLIEQPYLGYKNERQKMRTTFRPLHGHFQVQVHE